MVVEWLGWSGTVEMPYAITLVFVFMVCYQDFVRVDHVDTEYTSSTLVRDCTSFLRQPISFCRYSASISFARSSIWRATQIHHFSIFGHLAFSDAILIKMSIIPYSSPVLWQWMNSAPMSLMTSTSCSTWLFLGPQQHVIEASFQDFEWIWSSQ